MFTLCRAAPSAGETVTCERSWAIACALLVVVVVDGGRVVGTVELDWCGGVGPVAPAPNVEQPPATSNPTSASVTERPERHARPGPRGVAGAVPARRALPLTT
ncbi:MAG: hypothetical protein ACRDZX_08640 [Acidimicrobiales bacterium]